MQLLLGGGLIQLSFGAYLPFVGWLWQLHSWFLFDEHVLQGVAHFNLLRIGQGQILPCLKSRWLGTWQVEVKLGRRAHLMIADGWWHRQRLYNRFADTRVLIINRCIFLWVFELFIDQLLHVRLNHRVLVRAKVCWLHSGRWLLVAILLREDFVDMDVLLSLRHRFLGRRCYVATVVLLLSNLLHN